MKNTIQRFTLRRCLMFATFVLCTGLLFSCSKDDNGSPSNDNDTSARNFNPNVFKIINIHAHQDDPQYPRILYIDYTIKNVSSEDYNGPAYYIKWKVKGSDGAYYEGTDDGRALNAGASQQMSYTNLSMGTDGNIADTTTLTYTITDED